MTLRNTLVKAHWVLSSQFGLDPWRLLRGLCGIPRFLRHRFRFRRGYAGPLGLAPCLHDWDEDGGGARSEYFLQDLLVARWIFEENPERHVDVGSRVDGFVAHLASFRGVEVFDVRRINAEVPGVVFRQVDFMRADVLPAMEGGFCDSLSCLHALEHFGLGRYGDPIEPRGWEFGIANMAQMLKPGGRLYLSTPIGQERVEFNANRVFDPRTIIRCAESNGLRLKALTVIGGDGAVTAVSFGDEALFKLARLRYNLGIFVFTKMGQG